MPEKPVQDLFLFFKKVLNEVKASSLQLWMYFDSLQLAVQQKL